MTDALWDVDAISYGRNSSAKQKSIVEQLAENRADRAVTGWTIIRELSDPVSASRYTSKARKNWQTILDALPDLAKRTGRGGIILWEPSRGDRKLATWAAFLDACRDHHVLIRAVTHNRIYDPGNPRDYRSLAEDGVDSAYESDKIHGRTMRGLVGSQEKGHPHGKTPYGYSRTFTNGGDFLSQFPDPVTSKVVADIFEWASVGTSFLEIARRLERRGVPTPNGAIVWRGAALRYILTNPAYRPHPGQPSRTEDGREVSQACNIRHGKVLDVPGCWEPIVTESVWRSVQEILGATSEMVRKERRSSAPGHIKYMLSGNRNVMHSACGEVLSGDRGKTYICRADGCSLAPMPEADEVVSRLVCARLAAPDARDLWAPDDGPKKAAREELARLRDNLDRARRDYAEDLIDGPAFAMKKEKLEPLIADAERRAEPVDMPLAALKLIEAAEHDRETVRPTWNAMPVTVRREVIASIFEELALGRAVVKMTRWTPYEERLIAVAARISYKWRQAESD